MKLLVLALAFALSAGPLDARAQQAPTVPTSPLQEHVVADRLGRSVHYFLSHPRVPAPLLIMIQGSGCEPLLKTQGGSTYSTLFNLLPFASEGQFTVLAVEKPFVESTSNTGSGLAADCSPAFKRDFNADSWLVAIQAALTDAARHSWVDRRRTIVLGASEGGVMAALLAGHDSRITDVIDIGGSGTTQLFDFVALAYRNCFDRQACLSQIERMVGDINRDPDSSEKLAWGHPYKRWSSFFKVDPANELLRSKARVYIAFGTSDESVPALSQEVAVAKLRAAGRDVTVRRVPDAGHSLMPVEAPDITILDKEYRRALAWVSSPASP